MYGRLIPNQRDSKAAFLAMGVELSHTFLLITQCPRPDSNGAADHGTAVLVLLGRGRLLQRGPEYYTLVPVSSTYPRPLSNVACHAAILPSRWAWAVGVVALV